MAPYKLSYYNYYYFILLVVVVEDKEDIPSLRRPYPSSRRPALGLRVPSSLRKVEGRSGGQGRRQDMFHLVVMGSGRLNVAEFTVIDLVGDS